MKSLRMLHIGKTGGSSLKSMIKASRSTLLESDINLKGRSHEVTMKDLKQSNCDGIIVFVRHPVARFVSAFNSRLRQGQPRYDSPWQAGEKIIFALFKEPNQLAEALSSDSEELRTAARLSMFGINHVRDHMGKWLVSTTFLEKNQNLLYFIGTTETMDSDADALFAKMGVPKPETSQDEVTRHATPAGYSTSLSDTARANLIEWYQDDVAIYDWCVAHKEEVNGTDRT